MCALFCFFQFKACTACYHVHTMIDEIADKVFEVKQHRATAYKSDIVYTERRLQGGELIQFIQHHLRIGIAFDVYLDAYIAFREVTYVADALYLLVADEVAYVLYKIGFDNTERNLCDNNFLSAAIFCFDNGV